MLASLGKGNFFAEIALFDSQPRTADVVAVSPTTCFGIPGPAFERERSSAALAESQDESAYNKEIWRKLPDWMRVLDDLKRKARKRSSE